MSKKFDTPLKLAEFINKRMSGLDPRVFHALSLVDPRWFVDPTILSKGLSDEPMQVYKRGTVLRNSLAPSMAAIMLQALEVEDGMAILTLGSKGGYLETLLAVVLSNGRITCVDPDPHVCERMRTRIYSLLEEKRLPETATTVEVIRSQPMNFLLSGQQWRRIMVTAAITESLYKEMIHRIPPPFLFLAPVDFKDFQALMRARMGRDGKLYEENICGVQFVPLDLGLYAYDQEAQKIEPASLPPIGKIKTPSEQNDWLSVTYNLRVEGIKNEALTFEISGPRGIPETHVVSPVPCDKINPAIFNLSKAGTRGVGQKKTDDQMDFWDIAHVHGCDLWKLISDTELGRRLWSIIPTEKEEYPTIALRLLGSAIEYPWELMQVAKDGRNLPLSLTTNIYRTVSHMPRDELMSLDRILFIMPSPKYIDLPPLMMGEKEIKEIQASVKHLQSDILTGENAKASNFKSAMESGKYDAIHYIGHSRIGKRGPELLFTDHPYSSEDFADLAFEKGTRLCFLNSCHSGTTVDGPVPWDLYKPLIQRGVKCVVGMLWPIFDFSATELAKSFYGALQNNRPNVALRLARKRVFDEYGKDDPTWAAPVLFQ